MTDLDVKLLKAITEALEAAETQETQRIYLDMLTALVCMYVDTKEKN